MVGEFADTSRELFDLLDRLGPPEVDDLPVAPPKPKGGRGHTLLADLALFLLAPPLMLAALIGTAQLGSAASMSAVRVDTRSKVKVDYGAWPPVEFRAVSPALLEDIARDQSLFPDIYGGAASPLIVPGDFWKSPLDLVVSEAPGPAPSGETVNCQTIKIKATVHLLWGILSLDARSNEFLDDISVGSALPLLLVVDSRGNGEGWHLTVRASEERSERASDSPDVSRYELSLPEANIKSIDGHGTPSSEAELPTPMSEADQLLAVAESGEGMGTFGLVPSIYQLVIGKPSRDVPLLELNVSIIASP